MKKLNRRKAAGKDKFTGQIIKSGSEFVIDWICKLCNITFRSDVMGRNGDLL